MLLLFWIIVISYEKFIIIINTYIDNLICNNKYEPIYYCPTQEILKF